MIIKSDLKDLVIPPTMLSFITTNKCTAACRNCCFKCNPKNNERLSLEVIKKHIDTALSSFTSIKVLILTGGECFTLGDDLFSVIDYGAKKGLITRVVSNAYWAMTFKRTYNMISKLKQSGLSELNVSTGDEHLEWISLDNIVNVIIASIKLNFTVVINIESSELKNFNKQMLLNDIRLKKYDIDNCDNVHIFNGRWIYFNNEKKENVKKKNVLVSNISHKRCTSLFSTLTINSNNTVIACCGITSLKNNFLYLGDAEKYSIIDLYEYQFDDFIKIWLFTEGPLSILNFCLKHKNMPTFKGNMHICQICSMIFNDNENISILRKYYKEVFQEVFWKYSILKIKYFKCYKIEDL